MKKKVGSKGQAVMPLNDSDRDEIMKIVSIALTITRTLFDTLAATDVAIDNKLTYVAGLIPENVLNADEWQILVDRIYECGHDERRDFGGIVTGPDYMLNGRAFSYPLIPPRLRRFYRDDRDPRSIHEAAGRAEGLFLSAKEPFHSLFTYKGMMMRINGPGRNPVRGCRRDLYRLQEVRPAQGIIHICLRRRAQ